MATMKEKAGEVTDDEELEAEGKAQKYDGKGQEAWGTVKEKACDLEEKVTE